MLVNTVVGTVHTWILIESRESDLELLWKGFVLVSFDCVQGGVLLEEREVGANVMGEGFGGFMPVGEEDDDEELGG